MILSDKSGRIRMANPTADEVFGYEHGELLNCSISDLVPKEKHDVHERYRDLFSKDTSKRLMGKGRELQGVRKDGTVFPLEISLNAIESEDGERLVLSSVIDITDRLREQKLTELKILEVQEKERERIAKDLHDGITQLLSAISMNHQALSDKEDPELLENLRSLTEEAIQEARALTHDLMPPNLADKGPVKAIEEILERVGSNKGIRTEFTFPKQEERYSSGFELALYRICQEGVNNASKHAKASNIWVTISEDHGDGLYFLIGDDGVGSACLPKDDDEDREGGMGLNNMRQRVEAVNGHFNICSAQGKGTKIEGFLPFDMDLHKIRAG